MDVNALCDMFPALARDVIVAQKRVHKTEDALVTALMDLQEAQGGVAARGQPVKNVTPPAPAPSTPLARGAPKVVVPSTGNVPNYWHAYWESVKSKYAPLLKVCWTMTFVLVSHTTSCQADAEHALFFDRHFAEVSETEGKQEMANVLSRLAKHPPKH